MKHTSEALGWVVLETITRHDRYTYQEIAGGTTLYHTKQAALKVKRDCENRRYERRGERVYTVEPVGSDPSAVRELVEALEKIGRWFGEFPSTGKTWPDGEPISYIAAYGSNGERDYMRGVAIDALEKFRAPGGGDDDAS